MAVSSYLLLGTSLPTLMVGVPVSIICRRNAVDAMSLLVPIRGVHSILKRFLNRSSRSDSLSAWSFLTGSSEDLGLELNLTVSMTQSDLVAQ